MRDDPTLDMDKIAACLASQYGVLAASVAYLPIGYDPNAFVHKVLSHDGVSYFLKVRVGPVHEPSLSVPRALLERGFRNVLAPLPARAAALWSTVDGLPGNTLVLFPFIEGSDAVTTGLSDDQWREFGATLRAVHDSGLEQQFRGQLPVETFGLHSAALVRRMLDLPEGARVKSAAAAHFKAFWRERANVIRRMLARTESLGTRLQARSFDHVLCHADIHAANMLVGNDGRIWLVDWDGSIIAPRERDLLFVVGSKIARAVERREEELFFETYGHVEINLDALIYYRYERIIEDLGVIAEGIFLNAEMSEQVRESEAQMAMSFFAPGADIESAALIRGERRA